MISISAKVEVAPFFGQPVVRLPELVKEFGGHRYYKCPWCSGEDHFAVMSMAGDLAMRPLHCYVTRRLGWVNVLANVVAVLQEEEAKFRKVLKKFEGVQSMTADEACTAWHSQGLPYELAEEIVDDVAAFRTLCAAHRQKGKSGDKFSAVYG